MITGLMIASKGILIEKKAARRINVNEPVIVEIKVEDNIVIDADSGFTSNG